MKEPCTEGGSRGERREAETSQGGRQRGREAEMRGQAANTRPTRIQH